MREYVSQKRFPFAPLLQALGEVYDPIGPKARPARITNVSGLAPTLRRTRGVPIGLLGELIGVHPRTVLRWSKIGVPENRADDVAGALGMHPSEIWPQQWFGPYGLTA